jgi:primosomal protein N' (replication factor Y)
VFAEVVINIEAPLDGVFDYHIPKDLHPVLAVGHLVEVEFGRRLAQGIIVGFTEYPSVENTKPIIGLIDQDPVVQTWQIDLAQWISSHYLTPINACLRLMLPPGLSRRADVTLEIDPSWDGSGLYTDAQHELVVLLKSRGDLRGRQISKKWSSKTNWRTAANQLVRRGVLRRASVLDPPRSRPKVIKTAELNASPSHFAEAAMKLGRNSKQSEALYYLVNSQDPLPKEDTMIAATRATKKDLQALEDAGLIRRIPSDTIVTIGNNVNDQSTGEVELLNMLPASLTQLAGYETEIERLKSRGLVRTLEQPNTVNLTLSESNLVSSLFKLRKAEKYHQILNHLLKAATAVQLSAVYSATGTSMYHLRKLEALGLIRFGQEEVWRDPLADRDFVPSIPPRLTEDQEEVWREIETQALASSTPEGSYLKDSEVTEYPEKDKPFLLHGVTGSGKTEIYMRAVDLALRQGKQAIVLVPEIALTPQTVRRFAARFPGQVAVLHSRLSDGERYDTWRRARQRQFSIIIGPRSALFTPMQNLGVIILDEEHDHSYKHAPPIPPPYYHTRDVAIRLGRLSNAVVIMGSATPDIVTYHQARAGRYSLLELPKRIMGHRQRIHEQAERLATDSLYKQEENDPNDALTISLPPVQVVDLRQELRAGNRSIFSRSLESAVDETLANGEQTILFLNRRGTATFIMCRDCGLVLSCPRCDAPLTYHRPKSALVCHYCGRNEPQHTVCPRCESHRIKYFGLGTEELQRFVQQKWPDARTLRWDRDTTAGRDSHETLLASFIKREADILVGTQMIAKGLDLPLVTLVGVISADVSLGLPDFSIGERAFQLLTQVAGRAGRGLRGGRVIVQTYQPDHYAVQAASEHDYTRFYLDEIRFRTQHSLPPFRRLAKLIIVDPIENRARTEAMKMAKALKIHIRDKALGATDLIGPAPPFFARVDGRYRWQVIVRSPDPIRLLKDFPIPSPWIVDIDPVSAL